MIEKTRRILYKIEDAFLVCLLLLLMITAVSQIVLRNFFSVAITWSDPLVRVLVLWIGMAGAVVAGRKGNHISIDVFSGFLPARVKRIVKFTVNLFAVFVCGVAGWHGWRFVHMEFFDGGQAFGVIPVWICESVIPAAFTILALRYLILACEEIAVFFGYEP